MSAQRYTAFKPTMYLKAKLMAYEQEHYMRENDLGRDERHFGSDEKLAFNTSWFRELLRAEVEHKDALGRTLGDER